MSENKELLSKNALIAIGITALSILIVGIVLLALGYNEAFYVENESVRTFFEIIAFTGEPIFFIVFVAIFYIAYDKKFAKNLALTLAFSAYLNEFLKEVFKDPRPATNIDKTAEYGYIEPGYGFPSGHSQNAVAIWGYMGYHFKDKTKPPIIIPIILSILIFLIALSRIILGMHDLQDIIGGLVIGIGFLLAFIYLEPIANERFEPLSLMNKIIIVIVVSIALFLVGTLLFPKASLGLVKNAPSYTDEGSFALVGGIILGLGVGYLLENEYIKYQPHDLETKQKIINLILGLIILFAVYFAFEVLKGVFNSVVYRYVRYALVSFILTFISPLLFKKINKR